MFTAIMHTFNDRQMATIYAMLSFLIVFLIFQAICSIHARINKRKFKQTIMRRLLDDVRAESFRVIHKGKRYTECECVHCGVRLGLGNNDDGAELIATHYCGVRKNRRRLRLV